MDDQSYAEEQQFQQLRWSMRELSDRQFHSGAQVQAPVQAVLKQGRRRRRIRRAAAATAVAACVLAAALLTQSLAGAAGHGRERTAVAAKPSASSVSRLPKRTFDPGHPPARPSRVVYGRTYAFDWYVGCNSTFLNFGGKTWLVQGTVTVPSGLPRPNGPNSYNPVLPGYIIVSGKDDGRFEAPGYLARSIVLLKTDPMVQVCR